MLSKHILQDDTGLNYHLYITKKRSIVIMMSFDCLEWLSLYHYDVLNHYKIGIQTEMKFRFNSFGRTKEANSLLIW